IRFGLLLANSLPLLIVGLLAAERLPLGGAEAAREDASEAVEVVGAVGVVRHGPELEVPALRAGPAARVREHVLDLLRLAVAEREQDLEVRVRAAGELASRRG